MRKIDTNKQQAIQQAVYDLVAADGLTNLSMSKISDSAHVSPATIYIYYADKKDLLSQMYMSVKSSLDQGLMETINHGVDVTSKLKLALLHFAKFYEKHPKEILFMWTMLHNSTEVSEEANAFCRQRAAVVVELISTAIREELLITSDILELQALTFGSLSDYLQNGGTNIDVFVDHIVDRLID